VLPLLDALEQADFLKSIGFDRLKTTNPYCKAFKNVEHGLVVKNALFIGRPPREMKVKTVVLGRDRWTPSRVWVMQPLVDTTQSAKAFRQIKKKLKKRKRHTFVDIHQFNVGFLGKKAVMFDW